MKIPNSESLVVQLYFAVTYVIIGVCDKTAGVFFFSTSRKNSFW